MRVRVKKLFKFMKNAAIAVIVSAVIFQPHYHAASMILSLLPDPVHNFTVPPLEQQQKLTTLPAVDGQSMLTNPLLKADEPIKKPEPRTYEDISKRTGHTKTIIGADGKTTKRISLVEPLHYEKNGKWEDLHPKSEKKQKATILSVGDLKMTAKPLSEGLDYEFKGKKFSMFAEGAYNSEPKFGKEDGKDTVTYENAFKDVDIKYYISGYSIKEFIIIKSQQAQTSFNFSYKGITLKDHPSIKGAIAIEELPKDSLYIAPLNVSTSKQFVTDPVISQQHTRSGVQVNLDANWLKSLKDDHLPVMIDPTWMTFNKRPVDSAMQAIRSDGYRCGYPTCSPTVGNEEYPSYWASWRTVFSIPFDEIGPLADMGFGLEAKLHLVRNGGVSSPAGIKVAPSGCWDFNCAIDEAYSYATVENDSWINMTETIKWMIFNDMQADPMVLYSIHESQQIRTIKSFDLSQMYLEIRYLTDTRPPTPAAAYPDDKKVISNLQPTLAVNPVTDPDGDPVRYVFGLMSSPNDIITTKVTTIPNWTIPDGLLKDGVTYYWYADVVYGQAVPPPQSVRSFKIDLRQGKDSTQSYDTIGPISIDQATGNASTSVSSHTLKALGGEIGANLDYNTPAVSRPGLVAEYWDNTTMTGAPKLTTTVPAIDFNWGAENGPLPSYESWDNFTARYTGYINVPQTGTYTLGVNRDDGARVYIDDQLVVDSWQCCGTNYGTSIPLTAGKPARIKVEYLEQSATASIQLLAKGPSLPLDGQVVDRSWLQTGVKAVSNNGLQADYYRAAANNTFPSSAPVVSTEETVLDFKSNAGLSDRVPGSMYVDLVRYKGYLRVPTTGLYKFTVNHDGGMRLRLNNSQLLIDNWDRSAYFSRSNAVELTAGQLIPIEVEYLADITRPASLKVSIEGPDIPMQVISPTWLSQQKEVLPSGWKVGVAGSGASFDYLRVNNNSATLVDSSGSTHEYKWEQNTFIPPQGEHGILVRNADSTYNFKDDNGKEYVFNSSGNLVLMTTPTDDKKPTALKYVYSGSPSRLTKISDGINESRYAELYYAGINDNGTCNPPAGWDTVPTGYLCKVKTQNGVETNLRYKQGNLARVEGAGDTRTDFGYDALGRIVQVRDPLANDAIRTGVRGASDNTTFDITYDELGRVNKVTYPAATSGATRLANTYTYLVGATELHKVGASEPKGYSQRIEYDDSYRTVRSFGLDGKSTQIQWDAAKDIILATTDPLGLKTTTVYDAGDRPTAKYGPAPADWFNSNNLPTEAHQADMPKTESKYDEGMQGLAASFYDNKHLVREPKAHSFERGDLMRQWTTANRPVTPTTDGWGVRLTGEIVLPEAGAYTIKLYSDDGVKAYIDDRLYIDDWTDGNARYHEAATFDNAQAGKRVKIRIDYYDKDQNDLNSKLELRIYKPGATEAEAVQTGQFLVPNFSLSTSETVTDSNLGQLTNSKTYNRPEYGILDKITLDPAGLNYASTTTTETPGQGFFRQTSKTLPGGNKTNYQYYTSFDTKDNPCTTVADPVLQGGMPKGKTEPDPDGAGPLTSQTSEMIYDSSGQVVAARINNEPYTCTTYDARGRVVRVDTPASGSRAGLASETNYAVDGNALKISTTDVSGAVTTELDLLGRTVKYKDAHGNVTTPTYDTQGRLISKTSLIGKEDFTYDDLDRLTKYTINGVHMASVFYDANSRIQNIDYPASNQKLVSLEYDPLLRVKAINWKLGDNSVIREEQTKSSTGLILSNKRTVGTDILDQNYTYDKAGRLRNATVGTHTMSYGFDPLQSSCGTSYNPNAHKNANRTSQTIDGVTTTYCYDFADRLISSSDANYNNPIYDDRGNITQIGSTDKPLKVTYDQANRAIKIEQRDPGGNGTITEYKRDAGGRVLERKQIKLTNGAQTTVSQVKYGYTTSGDSPDIITNMSGSLVQRTLGLPGGITLTLTSNEPDVAKQRTYSIPNFHGDTMITTNFYGAKTGAFTYDPFGNQLDGNAPPQNNSPPGTTNGYLGQYSRPTEKEFSIPVVQMGDRIYLPGLGRFIQPDPVEGGNANAYIYPADPVNGRDLDGNFAWFAPIIWFAVTAIVSAVVVHVVEKVIDKVVPPPYRAPAKTAVAIASFASAGGAARSIVTKAPVYVPKVEKVVKNVFGSQPYRASVHGNSRASDKPTRVYELWTNSGQYLKTGITSNPIPENRYPKSFMLDKHMEFPLGGRAATMLRSDALDIERLMIMKNPGPLNKERWLK